MKDLFPHRRGITARRLRRYAAAISAATGCGTFFRSSRGIEEAKRFIAHPGLGRNLREISNALLALDTNDPAAVMGWPDNLKLCSCMTLFEAAAPDEPVFGAVLDKFYGGERDSLTLEKLR